MDTPTPLDLLQRAMQLHAETLIDHKERLGVHQHWLTAYAEMLEQHHLRMDELQRTLEHIDLTLTAIKDLLGRDNGHEEAR